MSLISIADNLPPVLARKDVSRYLGGIISPKTLANLDSLGEGPSGRFKVGRTVVYPTAALLMWLEERSR